MNHIILASASPRRKELLEQVKLAFQIRVSSCEEIITKTIPYEVVMELSHQKASDIRDTILGKPATEEEAYSMLEHLSGNIHQVYTGVTLIRCKNQHIETKTFYEKTDVYFYPLTPEKIKRYVDSKDCMDKAGAYGIQGEAAAFVRKIDGDYNNVVGLPVARLLLEMESFE